MTGVAGLLLAAGQGSRLGRPKALVRLSGATLVERGLGLLRAAGLEPVVVVLGAAADEVASTADLSGAEVVVNHDWRAGMGSSFRLGLEHLGGSEARAAVVALVDQPRVEPEAVRRLVDAWAQGATIAVAAYAGQGRNPVLFDREIWGEAAAHAIGDRGARSLLDERPDLVVEVPCDDVGAADDIDTAEDLAAVEAALDARGEVASG